MNKVPLNCSHIFFNLMYEYLLHLLFIISHLCMHTHTRIKCRFLFITTLSGCERAVYLRKEFEWAISVLQFAFLANCIRTTRMITAKSRIVSGFCFDLCSIHEEREKRKTNYKDTMVCTAQYHNCCRGGAVKTTT